MLEASIVDVEHLLVIEKEERTLGSQTKVNNIQVLETYLRDETFIREELNCKTAQEALEIVKRLQVEQMSHEQADMQLQRQL